MINLTDLVIEVINFDLGVELRNFVRSWSRNNKPCQIFGQK